MKKWLGLIAVAGISLQLVNADLAGAHAVKKIFSPAPDSVVTSAPDKLDMQFTEGVKELKVDVLNQMGESVLASPAIVDAKNPANAAVPLKKNLPQGAYTVKWQATSIDGHASSGYYKFYITTPSTSNGIRIFVDGKELKGVPAQIINGHTMVPIRDVAESLGKWVEWEPKQKILTISNLPAAGHHHDIYLHPAGTPAPTVKLEVKPDAKGGFNVHVETTNWTWAPEHVNGEAVPNEGHAHLYVDGVKVARLYGPWYHLDALTPGPHDITVTLNANNHGEYAVDENHVLKSTVSIVNSPAQKEEHNDHTH
jgi:methionine-rich copper-binding protein CopC